MSSEPPGPESVKRARADAKPGDGEEWLVYQKDAFQAAVNGAPIEESLDVLVRATIAHFGDVRCGFYAVKPDNDTELRHVTGMSESYAACVDGFKVGPDSLACGLAVSTGRPVITPDVTAEPRWKPWLWMAEQHDFRACWSFPIEMRSGKLVGSFAVYFRNPRDASPRDRAFASMVAQTAALLIWHYQEAEKRIRSEAALRGSEERLAATFTQAAVGLCEIALDGRFLRVNDALCHLLGRNREELLATDILSLSHPDDLAPRTAVFEHVLATGETGSIDKRLLLPNGDIVWVNATLSLLKGQSDAPTILEVIVDLTDRRRAEKAIRDNEHWLQTLMEGVPLLLWRAVGEGSWTWSSPQWSAFTGLSVTQSTGKGWLDAVHPDDRAHAEHCWRKAQEKGAFHADYRVCHRKEDRWRWFQSRATALRDEKGAIVEWLGSSTDVDELRTLRNQQEVLIAELQHRTRNLIAVTQSVWRQTFRNAATPREAEQQFSDRLNALSRVQGLLSRSNEKPVTIGDLVGMEMEALGAGALADRIHIEGPEVRLRSGIVQTFALALHELATNARKYGALSNARGRLDIGWEVRDGEDRRHLLLEWRETGIIARETGRAGGGYGRELIERALPYSLNAKTRFDLGETELLCTIDLPLGE